MPYPNFHSARIKDPKLFDNIVVLKKLPNGIMIYGGRLKGEEKTTEQAYRFPKDKFTVSEAKAWLSDHKIDYILFEPAKSADTKKASKEKTETFELENIQILTTGTWTSSDGKKNVYTEEDLEKIVEAFDKLSGKVNVPLVLGHSPEQKLLQSDGYPSAGWLNNLKIIEKKLVGTFKGVPKKIKQLIDLGAYKSISAEIYPDYQEESTGEKFKRILWRIALLGADHKAMTTLDDMLALYTKYNDGKSRTVQFKSEKPLKVNLEKEEVNEMDLEKKIVELESEKKEFESKNEGLKEKIETLEKTAKELEETKKERDEAKTKVEKFEKELNDSKIKQFIAKVTKDGKIIPAQKDNVFRLLSAMGDKIVKFTVEKDGKSEEIEGSFFDCFEQILYSQPFDLVKYSEKSEQDKEEDDEDSKRLAKETNLDIVDDDIHRKAEAYSKEHDVPYDEALRKV